jgi:hypothetical protein
MEFWRGLVRQKPSESLWEFQKFVIQVAINCGCYMFSLYSAIITGVIAAFLTLLAGPIVDGM